MPLRKLSGFASELWIAIRGLSHPSTFMSDPRRRGWKSSMTCRAQINNRVAGRDRLFKSLPFYQDGGDERFHERRDKEQRNNHSNEELQSKS